jgi:hypothetical protein
MSEAHAYFEWFVAQVEPRSLALLERVGEAADGSPAVVLPRVGAKLATLVRQAPFSVAMQNGPELTNAGYALAADAALLLARALMRDHPNVKWEIVRKPKRDMAFRLPVLVGPGPVYLDVVGGSIADFQATLRAEGGPRVLVEGFPFWSARAERAREG